MIAVSKLITWAAGTSTVCFLAAFVMGMSTSEHPNAHLWPFLAIAGVILAIIVAVMANDTPAKGE